MSHRIEPISMEDVDRRGDSDVSVTSAASEAFLKEVPLESIHEMETRIMEVHGIIHMGYPHTGSPPTLPTLATPLDSWFHTIMEKRI